MKALLSFCFRSCGSLARFLIPIWIGFVLLLPNVASSKPTLEFSSSSAVKEFIDDFVIEMEQQRLMYILTQQPGFLKLYFQGVMDIVTSEPKITFRDIEVAQRKYNTGLNLIAMPKSEILAETGRNDLCVKGLDTPESKEATHVLWLENGDPSYAAQIRESWGLSEQQNLLELESVGIFTNCK